MTSEQIELARRAMALPGWEWRPGMFTQSGTWVTVVFDGNATMLLADEDAQWEERCYKRHELHLADPTGATDNILLKLLGPNVAVYYSYVNLEWVVAIPFGGVIARAPYLAEACCRAAVALGRWPGGAVKHEAKAEV